LRLRGGEIVEVDGGIVAEIFDVVDPSPALFLDRAARLVVLLLALLPTQPLGWGGRTEVSGSIAAAGTGRRTAGASRAWTETAAHWSWTATAEPAAGRSRASKAAAGRTWTGWTIFTRTRLADGEVAALERLRVELLNDLVGDVAVGKLDEREPARPAGFTIHRHDDVGRFRNDGEMGAEVGF
jgi:hypothetical protein